MTPVARGFLLLLVAVVALGGCGGGGSDGNNGGDGGPGGGGNPPPPVNRAPVAVISGPTSSETGIRVTFDGRGSSDPDGDTLGYRWTLSAPSGSAAALSSPSASQPTLLPDVAGSYRLQLVVSDGRLDSAPAVHTLPVTARSPINLTVQAPPPGEVFFDAMPVIASVHSTYEVTTVTATVGGRTTNLVFTPNGWCVRDECYPAFVATLSLAGLPSGEYELVVAVTDVRGNSTQRSVRVVHQIPVVPDPHPALIVKAPLDGDLALPVLTYDASCTDNAPGCVVELLVNDEFQRGAPGSLRGELDMSAWAGPRTITVTLLARDSGGRVTRHDATVYLEDVPRLRTVLELPGEILDADERRLLYLERAATGDDGLAIYDRVTGLTERVAVADGWEVQSRYALLTPNGAIFVVQAAGGNSLSSRVFLWRLQTLTDLGYPESNTSLTVAGNYALWSAGLLLYRLDTATAEVTQVATNAGNIENDVTADGTVVYWTRSHEVVRVRAGQSQVLASGGGQWHVYTRADRDKVVYLMQDPCCETIEQTYVIVLIDGTTALPLTARRSYRPLPDEDYQVVADWVAYTDSGNLGQMHVFTRSPAGVVTQHTDRGTTTRIERLAGNGEVMMFNYGRRYLSRGAGMIDLSPETGRSYWLTGQWYVASGNAWQVVETGSASGNTGATQ